MRELKLKLDEDNAERLLEEARKADGNSFSITIRANPYLVEQGVLQSFPELS